MAQKLQNLMRPLASFVLIQTLLFLSFTYASAQLSGTYTINASSAASATNYKNFTSAVGDMLSGTRTDGGAPNGGASPYGVSGAVTFQVAAGTYSEQITITAINGASASSTITFQGVGLTSGRADSSQVVLTQASASSVGTGNFTLFIKGASFLRFKNMTISRTGTLADGTVMQIGSNGTTGSLSNLISHCQVLGGAVTTSSTNQCDIYISDKYDSLNIFRNNLVKNGSYGFYILGVTGSPLALRSNLLDSNIVNGPYVYGINAQFESNLVIQNGKIINTATAGAATGTTLYGVSTTGCNALRVSNVTMSGFNGTASSTQYGIYNVVSTTGANDSIINNTISGMPGNAACGIYNTTNNPLIQGNTITGFTGTGSTVYGIYMPALILTPQIINNQITNFSGTTGSFYGIGLTTGGCTNPIIMGNTISGITNSGSSEYGIYLTTPGITSTLVKIDSNVINMSGVVSDGIYLNGSSPLRVRIVNNKIFLPGGTQANTFSSNPQYAGILMYNNNTGGTAGYISYVANNMVTIGGTNVSFGIADYWSVYTNYYYNSVLITNTNTSSSGFYYYVCCTSPDYNIQNNISANTGGGYAITIYNWGNNFVNTLNNNDWYTTGSNFAYWPNTAEANLAAWKTASGKDVNSISVNPYFVSSSTGDLHATNPSLKIGAVLAAISYDYDGQTRSAITPMVGADEFTPPTQDAGCTSINNSIYCGGTTTVNVTLTNFGTTTLTSAKINWTVNSVAQTQYSWAGSLASGASASFNVGTFTSSSGSYTLTASSASPNGGTDGNSANDAAPNITIQPGMSGNYTINPSGSGGTNFTSFTNAINSMVANGLCGPVVFSVANGTYTEQIAIPAIFNASASNRITFVSAANDSTKVTLTYASTLAANNYTVYLNGASYVTFRKITIQATGTSFGVAVNLQNTPTYDSFANCILNSVTTTSNTSNISVVYNNQSSTSPETNTTFYNNVINNGAYGFYWNNSNSNAHNDQIAIIHNQLNNQYSYGWWSQYSDGVNFNYNTITSNTTIATYYGVYFYWSMSSVRANQIIGNRIYGNMSGFGMDLTYLGVNSNIPSTVANNMVKMGKTTSATTTYAYYFSNNYQVYFYYNTGAVYGTSASNYACYIGATFSNTASTFYNNIFANLGNGTASFGAAFYTQNLTSPLFNYNDLYVLSGNIANYNGTFQATLAAWKGAAGGNDANSIAIPPAFTSVNDLHAKNGGLKAGTSVSAIINTDFDGLTRAATPTIGCNEISTLSSVDAGIYSVNLLNYCGGAQSVPVTIENYGSSTITSATINWTVNNVTQTAYSWTGSVPSLATTPVNIGTYNFSSGTYNIVAWTSNVNGLGADAIPADDTAKANNLALALGGTYTIAASGGNYASFTAAATALKTGGVCGPVVFKVAAGTYVEQVSIPYILGASATNTITFQGAGLTSGVADSSKVNLSYPSATAGNGNYAIELNGAQYVTFKNITITRNGGISGNGTCIWVHGGASNNQFLHNRIFGVRSETTSSTSYADIYSGADIDNNNLFRNNNVTGGYYGFYWYGVNNSPNGFETGNIIDSNTIDSTYQDGIVSEFQNAFQITTNKVRYIGYNGSSYANTSGIGIYSQYSTNVSQILRNQILLPGGASYGLYTYYTDNTSYSSNASSIIANNFIYIGGTVQAYGIYDYYPTNENFFYNNINITSTSASSADFSTYTCCTLTGNQVRNNIFVNTGGGYAIYVANWQWQSYYTTGALTSNNDYYVTGTNFCYNAGTNYTPANLSGWQSAITGDANSQAVNPNYTSATDLHATNTLLKGAGINVTSVTTDIDQHIRPSNPAIGANEQYTTGLDAGVGSFVSPATPFAAGSQAVTVKIVNFGTTTLTSAQITWTVNSSSQIPVSWTGSLTTGQAATVILNAGYTFNLGTSYTITAKTNNPNGGTDLNPANDQLSLTACPGLSAGTYTINPLGSGSSNFTSFTNAVNAMSCGGVAGPVTFSVASGTYTEQLAITSIIGASNTNRVTFVSTAHDSTKVILTYSGSSSGNYTLYLNGASYITFRQITINGANSSYGDAVYLNNNPSNDSFSNCIISGPSTTSSTTNLSNIYYAYSASINPITFYNNVISNGSYGVYWYGTSGTHSETTNFIHNQFINQYAYGAYFFYVADIYFNNNTITSSSTNTGYYGLEEYWLESTSRGSQAMGNKIYGGMAGYGMNFQYISVNSGLVTTIANNLVIMGSTSQTNPAYGIYAYWYNPGDIYNNTSVVYGTNVNNYAMNLSAAVSGAGSDYVKNNIFANLGNGTSSYGVAIYVQNAAWFNFDYDDYYVLNGGYIGSLGGADYTSLAAWQAAVSPNDANSQAQNPSFASSSDLHISNLCLRGISGLGISTDYAGTARGTPPSMGAYEASNGFSNDLGVSAISAPVSPFSPGSQSITVTAKNFGTNTITSGTVNYSVNGASAVSQGFTASLGACATTSVTFTTPYNFASGSSYKLKTWTSSPNGTSDNNHSNDTMTTQVCPAMSGIYTINPLGSGSTNFTSFTNAVNALICGGVSGPVRFNVSAGTYSEQINITTIAGASATNNITFAGQSDSSKVTLTYSSSVAGANYTVAFNGASYVTFRKMTIQATGGSFGYVLNIGANSNNDSITNCQLIGISGNNTSSNYAIVYSVSNINSNTVFNNNLFSNGAFGIYMQGNGTSSSTTQNYTVIQGNTFLNQYYMGIYLYYQTDAAINSNIISTTSAYTNWYGIYMYYCQNGSTGTRVLKNKISTTTANGYGIYNNWDNWASVTAQPAIIANNFIAIGSGSTTSYGIYNYYAMSQNYYYNSINLLSSAGYAMYNTSGTSPVGVNVEDNIIAATSGTAGAYAYYLGNTTYVTTENYNDYYVATGANFMNYSGTNETTLANWQSATSAASLDLNSVNKNPVFFTTTNLHTTTPNLYQKGTNVSGTTADIDGNTRATTPCIGAAEYVPSANDAGISAITAPTGSFCGGSSQAVTVTLNNFGTGTLTSAKITLRINGVAPIIYNWTGTILSGGSGVSVSIGSTTFPSGPATVVARTNNPNGGTDGNTANDSVSIYMTPSLTGTYTIGSGGNFASFSAAATALNTSGVCGPVTFKVANGTYAEHMVLNAIPGASATNRISFVGNKSDSTKVNLSYPSQSSLTATVELNGCSYVTFRNMTIKCAAPASNYGWAVWVHNTSAGTVPSTYDSFAHCQILGVPTTTNSSNFATVANYYYYNNGSTFCSNNTYSNNSIKNGAYGVWLYSYSNSPYETGNKVIANLIDSTYIYGIYNYYESNDLIANNMITIRGNTTAYGIYDYYTNSGTNYYYNTINVVNTNSSSACFYVQYCCSTGLQNMVDNVGVNTGGGLSIYSANGFYYYGLLSNNDWYTTGSSIGYNSGGYYNTMAGWQAATGKDAGSISNNPVFTSSSNLHAGNPALKAGTPVSVTTDFDGQTRNASTPDMGADEFIPSALDAGVTAINKQNYCTGSQTINVTLINFGMTTLTSDSVGWSVNGVKQTPVKWTGTLASGNTLSMNIGSYSFTSGAYSIKAWSYKPNNGTDGNYANDTASITNLMQGMSGAYTINPAGSGSTNFTTFASAVAALTSGGLCGSVVFKVSPGTYNEHIVITGSIVNASSVNTITFNGGFGDSNLVVLTQPGFSSQSGTVELNGASYIHFNEITIANTGGSTYTPAVYIHGGSNYNSFTHCALTGYSIANTSSQYAVVYSPTDNDQYNTFRNNLISNGSYAFYWYGSNSSYEAGTLIDSNTITGAYYMGINTEYMTTFTISRNTIINIGDNAGYGIYDYYCKNGGKIIKNKIFAPSGLTYGIYHYYANQPAGGSGADNIVANNMVTIGGSALTYGIYEYYNYEPATAIFYNSVYLSNTNSSSAGITVYDPYSPGDSLLNNISANMGGGYAIYMATTPGVSYMNYNDWYVPSSSSNMGNWAGTNTSNLAAWQTISGQDLNAVSINPFFTNVAAGNLHAVNGGLKNATPIVNVTDDFDGQTRSASKPDIGADEFTAPATDAGISAINQLNYCAGTQSVNVTLSNGGTNALTSATINWQMNGATQIAYDWTGSISSGNNLIVNIGNFNFVSGTYTIKAWSSSPNGTTDGNIYDDTSLLSNLQPGISGTYTIGGASPNYATFSAAVADLNTKGLCGPVIFNVRSGTYPEQISISNILNASALNTVVFQSVANDSSKVNLSWPSSGSAIANYTVQLNGANYVTFKKITITRNGSNSFGTVLDVRGGSNNNTFTHDRFLGIKTTNTSTTQANIFSGQDNDSNNLFRNNLVRNGSFGFYWYGSSSSSFEGGNVIDSNTIDSAYYMGIDANNENMMKITNSTISNLSYSNAYGLYAYYCNYLWVTNNNFSTGITGVNANGIYLGYCNNSIRITKNKIYLPNGSQTPQNGGGIHLMWNYNTLSAAPCLVANNMIIVGGNSGIVSGIDDYYTQYINYCFNSILITNNNATSSAFYSYNGYSSNENVENNCAVNTAGGYAVNVPQTTGINSGAMNYNDWYATGTNLGNWNGSNYPNLATWQGGSAKDANSLSINPYYTSGTDLHAINGGLKNGTPLAIVTDDIDGQTRSISKPDIGADEFTAPANDAGIVSISQQNYCAGTQNVNVTLSNGGTSTLTNVKINWRVNSVLQTQYNWTGSLTPGQTNVINIGTYTFVSGAYNIKAWTSLPNGGADGNSLDDTSSVNEQQGLIGTYTIGGASPNYATFGAAVADLNTKGLCGPVTFNVRAGTYPEQISIGNIINSSSTNRVIFQSATGDSSSVNLSWPSSGLAANNYTVQLNGASNVTIQKLTITRNGSNTYGTVLNIQGGSNNNIFANNRIFGVKTLSTGTTLATIYSPQDNDTNNDFKNNLVRNGSYSFYWYGSANTSLESSNTIEYNSLDSAYYMGINMENENNAVIKNNNITNVAYGSAYGLYLYYCQNSLIVKKNKISLLNGGYGIYLSQCTGISTAYASVYNNFIAVAGTSPGYGIYAPYNYYQVFYFNSINITNTSGSSRGGYFYPYSTTTLMDNNFVIPGGGFALEIPYTPYITSNYNNIYTTGAILGAWNGTTATSLALWKSLSGMDNNSVSVSPGYTSATDLHASAVGVNNKGIAVSGITDDIDGQLRSATVPDIGADEFSPYAVDAGVVAISPTVPYAPGNRTVTATFENFGSTTLTKVTLKWNVNGATQSSVNWTGSLTTGGTATVNLGTYAFSTGTSYTIMAKTNSPNGLADADPTNDSMIVNGCPGLSGTFSLGGASADFSSFSAAMNALSCGGVVGPVIFNISNGTYNEQITLGTIPGASAANTVTFKSATNNKAFVTLAYNATSGNPYVVKLNNARYVRFNQMTFTAQNSSYANVFYFANAADYDSVENCVLNGYNISSNSTNQAIVFSNNTNDEYNVFYNDSFNYGSYGVYLYGTNSNGTQILNCKFVNQYYMAINLNYESGAKIQNNIMTPSTNTNYYGIYTDYCAGGYDISVNKIEGLYGGYGIYDYQCTGTAAQPGYIYNNFIQVGNSSGNTSYGIMSYYGTYRKVYNNSINITSSSVSSGYAAYFYYPSSAYSIDIKNNIFANNGSGGTAGYAMYIYSPSYVTCDYNQLYTKGLNLSQIGATGTSYSSLSQWQSASSLDAHTYGTSPTFTSTTDLHISEACNNGVNIAYITKDIDGQVRNNPPDVGADESTTALANDAGVSAIISPSAPMTAGTQNIVVKLKNFGSNNLTSATVYYSVNGSTPKSLSWTGNLVSCDTTTITFSGANQYSFTFGTSYTIKSYTKSPNGTTDARASNDTTTFTACPVMNGTYTINPSGSGINNFTSFTAAVNAISCSGITGPVTFNVAAATYNERVTIPSIQGTSAINTVTFDGGAGNAATRILTYNGTTGPTGYTLRISSSQYIRIKNLTINATGTSYGCPVHIYGASSNTIIRNCILSATGGASSGSSNFSAVLINNSTDVSNVYSNTAVNNIDIDSCKMNYGYYGIFSYNNGTGNIYDNDTFANTYYYGLYLYANNGVKILRNSISMRNVNGLNSYGMYIYNCNNNGNTGTAIQNNKIINAGFAGIYSYFSFESNPGYGTIINNMIGGGFKVATATGIYLDYSTYWNVWNNSVNMDFATTSNNNAAFYSSSNNSYMNIQDNIFAYTAASGTGLPMYLANTTGLTMNYNDFYSKSGNAALIYLGSVTYTASTFNGGGGYNVNSKNQNPSFTSTTDLHIYDNCLRGIYLGVTTDIDGQTRSNPPSIGADELTGAPFTNDIGVVSILSPTTPLITGLQSIKVLVKNYGSNTVTSGNVSYFVNGGSPVTISLPVTLNPCDTATVVFTGANKYNFVLGSTYSVTSYTSGPNGASDNHKANDTAYSTNLCPTLSGVYTINPSGSGSNNFTSFTSAVNQLNCGGVAGPVVFNVASGTYTQQIDLNNIPGTSSTNTITFQSATGIASNVTLQYNTASSTSNNYVVRLTASAYIIFKNMTISNSNVNYGTVIMLNSTTYDTVKSCILAGTTSLNTSSNDAIVNINNSYDQYIVLQDNTFTNGSYGVYLMNNTAYAGGNVIFRNTFTHPYYAGIFLNEQTGVVIDSNTISFNNNYTNNYGVYMINSTGSYKITKNKITGIEGGNGIYFSSVSSSASTKGLIANNFIQAGASSFTSYGINIEFSSYVNVYHNSVNITSADVNNSYAFYFYWPTNGNEFVDVKNNIFANNGGGKSVYYYNFSNGTAGYNDVFTTGTILGQTSSNTYPSLAAWQAAGFDSYSLDIQPNFNSATDLHIAATCGFTGTGLSAIVPTDIDNVTRNTVNPVIGASEFSRPNYDVSGVAIISPTSPAATGVPTNVVLKLANVGSTTITSLNVNYRLNANTVVTQSLTPLNFYTCDTITVSFTSSSGPGGTDQRVTFPNGVSTLKAWATSLNGNTDQNHQNDTISNSYCAPYAGSYTINPSLASSATNYKTFNAAITALQSCGISGPVDFKVSNGNYNEQLNLGPLNGVNSYNTVTFESAAGDSSKVTLTWPSSASASNNYTVNLNGAKFFIFKEMTISRTGSQAYSEVINIQGGSYSNLFKNDRLLGIATTGTAGTQAVVYSPTDNDTGNKFISDNIKRGSAGIYLNGASSGYEKGTVIKNSIFDSCLYASIYLINEDASQITGNLITEEANSASIFGAYGIRIETSINGILIMNNKIYNNTNASYNRGIYLAQCVGAGGVPGLVANNFVVSTAGTSYSTALALLGTSYFNIYNNSILNTCTTAGSDALAVLATFAGGNNNFANNICVNMGGGNATDVQTGATSAVLSMDYNDLYSSGLYIGIWNGANILSITSWKTTSGIDSHSVAVNPIFTSNTDLHANTCLLKNRGTNVNVNYDIDGRSRGASPDPGAAEITGIAGQWTGATSTDWFTPFNWCNDTVPTCAAGTTAIIPSLLIPGATIHYPIVVTNTGSTKDLIIDGGASVTFNSGQLDICGNFINYGSLVANAGTFELNGNGPQNFSGAHFFNLMVNGSGTKTLESDAYVKNQMSLVNGTINTTTVGDTITLDSLASMSETNSGTINGWVQITRNLRQGVNDTFGGIGMSIRADSSAPGITTAVRMTGSNATVTGQPVSGGHQYSGIQRYFDITPTHNGHLGMTMGWHYLDGELNGISESDIATYRREQGVKFWNYVGYKTRNFSTNTITNTGLDSMSKWSFGSSITPLPVELLKFTAVLQDPTTARLDWTTASELNNDYFNIERSLDGTQFSKIGQESGFGTTSDLHNYTYFDYHVDLLLSQVIYYRLKQVDFNGNFTYSPIREVMLADEAKTNDIKVWYNQPEDRMYVNIQRAESTSVTLRLTDMNGKVIAEQAVAAQQGLTQVSLNLAGLSKGVYNLSATDNTGTTTAKIMKY